LDEVYSALIISPVLALARWSLRLDLSLIDGVVNWYGRVAEAAGEIISRLQSGEVRDYLLLMSLGAAAAIGLSVWF
jgi:NADH-quinone oxidoreductase subunit L